MSNENSHQPEDPVPAGESGSVVRDHGEENGTDAPFFSQEVDRIVFVTDAPETDPTVIAEVVASLQARNRKRPCTNESDAPHDNL